jgi:hypothetical protein
MSNSPAVIQKGGAPIIAAAIVGPIGEDDLPRVAKVIHNAAKVLEIVAEFYDGDEVELTDDFSNVMKSSVGALDLSKL